MDKVSQALLLHLYKNLQFAPVENQQNYQNHILKCLQGLIYAKHYLKQPSDDYLSQKLINLPEKDDLDETLISSTLNLQDPHGTIIRLQSEDNNFHYISVRIRPFVQEFLQKLSSLYEIYIFSAGKEVYVNEIVNLIDPEHQFINGILSQKHCLQTKQNMFIKDLRIINNRKFSEMVIVDNFVHSFSFQIENGIPILPWAGEPEDKQLLGLLNYLIQLSVQTNLNDANKKLLNPFCQ